MMLDEIGRRNRIDAMDKIVEDSQEEINHEKISQLYLRELAALASQQLSKKKTVVLIFVNNHREYFLS